MTEPASLLSAWSRLLVGSLVQAGLRDVVISPGSRSTPLCLALLEASQLRLASVLDERSAGFFALGIARESQRPTLLLCTSGTAAAHYYPAVIEASHSRLPLLIVTADRPGELQEADAPQTMNQTELFGRFARGFFELGEPRDEPSSLGSLARKAAQAWALSLGPRPGPVQLNFPARKPLEPPLTRRPDDEALDRRVEETLARAPHVFGATQVPSDSGLRHFGAALDVCQRPLIVLGAAEPSAALAVSRLARQLGGVVLAETAAHARGALPAEQLLRGFARDLPKPDLLLRFGAPLTSASLPSYQRSLAVPELLVAGDGFPDPSHTASAVLHGPLERCAVELLDQLDERKIEQDYLDAWKHAGEQAEARLQAALDEPAEPSASLGEASATHAVLSSLPDQVQVFLGNSSPLRLADAVSGAAFSGRTGPLPRVFVQRGVNGIDGTIAGAAGLALSGDCPTLALLGDVTAAHDLSSLAVARTIRVPLCLVVLDNGGGHIFNQLPLHAQAASLGDNWRFWSTPPELDWALAAQTYGVRFARAASLLEVSHLVARALRSPGTTLLHVATDASRTSAWFERAARGAP